MNKGGLSTGCTSLLKMEHLEPLENLTDFLGVFYQCVQAWAIPIYPKNGHSQMIVLMQMLFLLQ